MVFNFNEQDLEKAGEGKIFNDGKAGRVKGVKVSMEKLGEDYQSESAYAPRYRVIFTDAEGRKINKACFSIKAEDYPNQWGKTYEETIKKEWAYLAKIAEHTEGVKPMVFSDDEDLFKQMYINGVGTAEVNVFTNYGYKQSPKDRIEVRKNLPAVEPTSIADADTKLIPSNIELMSPILPDEEEDEDLTEGLY